MQPSRASAAFLARGVVRVAVREARAVVRVRADTIGAEVHVVVAVLLPLGLLIEALAGEVFERRAVAVRREDGALAEVAVRVVDLPALALLARDAEIVDAVAGLNAFIIAALACGHDDQQGDGGSYDKGLHTLSALHLPRIGGYASAPMAIGDSTIPAAPSTLAPGALPEELNTPDPALYIEGKRFEDGDRAYVVDPWTGERIGEVVLANELQADRAALAAKAAFESTKKMPSFERKRLLELIVQALKDEKEDFAKLIEHESGKPKTLARMEVEARSRRSSSARKSRSASAAR